MEASQNTLNNPRIGRRQYFVTYSQADSDKFPTRESFGRMLENEFNQGTGHIKVSHWACCKEDHKEEGFHYHCCLKLLGVKKWFSVKEGITKKINIVVNFSDSHNHYISAYRYVCKIDKQVVHSENHPDLTEVGSPRTKAATAASRKRNSNNNNNNSNVKRRKLTNLEVSDFIVKKTNNESRAVCLCPVS